MTAQLMFDFLDYEDAGTAIEGAVRGAIVDDQVTRDLGGNLTTSEVGETIAERISARVEL